MIEHMFSDLGLAVKEVGSLEHHSMGDDELSDAVVELARLRHGFEAAEARLSAAWDARRAWAADGARSGSAWAARRTRDPKAECGSRIWMGRAVTDMDQVASAWAAGDIGSSHVRRLARACNRRNRDAFSRDEAMLVAHASELTFDAFCQFLDYWLLHTDPDGAEQSDIERASRRRVSLDETLSGMYSGSVLLDPISGVIVADELERLEQALFDEDWAEATTRLGREPRLAELARTPDQRSADALVEMARRSGSTLPGAQSPRPLFSLVLGNDAFSHLCQLASGRVVSPAALLPWISSADIERILFEGGSSRVIDVSRKRSFTGALRRLIEVRDRLCYHDYCEEPAHRCQVDHVVPWAAGGMTDQSNGRLACGYHNRLRHRRGPPAPPR